MNSKYEQVLDSFQSQQLIEFLLEEHKSRDSGFLEMVPSIKEMTS